MLKSMFKGFLGSYICALGLLVFIGNDLLGQCGGETTKIINQCPNQYPQATIDGTVPSNVSYKWLEVTPKSPGPGNDTLKLSSNPSVTYPGLLIGTKTISYNKYVSSSLGPVASGFNISGANPTADKTVPYQIPITSPISFKLDYITVAIRIYSCGPTTEYRLKVNIGTKSSIWYYFRCSDLISTTSNGTYLVKVPLYKYDSNIIDALGIEMAAGTYNIKVTTAADATSKIGTSEVDGFEWFIPGSFLNSYTVNTAPDQIALNYGTSATTVSGSSKVPGLFDLGITSICNAKNITFTPNSAGCCVPANVLPVTLSSNSGFTPDYLLNEDPSPTAIKISASPVQNSHYYIWYKDGVRMSSNNNGVGKSSIDVTKGGRYTVRVVENAKDSLVSSCAQEDLYWLRKRTLIALASKTTVCVGESVDLVSIGALANIVWSPSTLVTSTNTMNTTFTPTTTGTQTITVSADVPAGNQIINGDFENNVTLGFDKGVYEYVPANVSTTLGEGSCNASVGTPVSANRKFFNWKTFGNNGNNVMAINEYIYCPGWPEWRPCNGDHTSGSGKYMYIDSYAPGAEVKESVNPNPLTSYFFKENVQIQPNTDYKFTLWYMNFDEGTTKATPDPLQKFVAYIGNTRITPDYNYTVSTSDLCQWKPMTATWNSGALSGTFPLSVSTLNGSAPGNDIAIDDISFGSPANETSTLNIIINDCDVYDATAICNAGVLTLTATTTNGFFDSWAHIPTSGTANTTTITDPKSATTTATPIATTKEYEATFKFVRGNQVPTPDYSSTGTNGTNMEDRSSQIGTYGFNQGQFEIGKAPALYSDNQAKQYVNVADHTTGSTTNFNYFAASGRYIAGKDVVFSQTINTTSGSEYGFSTWLANIHKEFSKASPDTTTIVTGSTAIKTTKLDLYVGGSFVKRFTLPLNTNWTNFSHSFKSTVNGNVNIQLRVPSIGTNGNESAFAMDDVSIGAVETRKKIVSSPCATPVTYTYFNLQNTTEGIQVNWGTAQERDSKYFVVERSRNGQEFEAIYTLPSGGNSNKTRDYSIVDRTALEGTAYYRIKEVGLSGALNYTKKLSISRLGLSGLSVYPNPFNSSFTVFIEGSEAEMFEAHILGIDGTVIEDLSLTINQKHEMGTQLKSGVYILEIQSPEGLIHQKIVKE